MSSSRHRRPATVPWRRRRWRLQSQSSQADCEVQPRPSTEPCSYYYRQQCCSESLQSFIFKTEIISFAVKQVKLTPLKGLQPSALPTSCSIEFGVPSPSFLPPYSTVAWPPPADVLLKGVHLDCRDWRTPRPIAVRQPAKSKKPLTASQREGVQRTLEKYKFISQIQEQRQKAHGDGGRSLVAAMIQRRRAEEKREQRVSQVHEHAILHMLGLAGTFRTWKKAAQESALLKKRMARHIGASQAMCFRAWVVYARKCRQVRKFAAFGLQNVERRVFRAWAGWMKSQRRMKLIAAQHISSSSSLSSSGKLMMAAIFKAWRRHSEEERNLRSQSLSKSSQIAMKVIKAVSSDAWVIFGAWKRQVLISRKVKERQANRRGRLLLGAFKQLSRNQDKLKMALQERTRVMISKCFTAWNNSLPALVQERLCCKISPSSFFMHTLALNKFTNNLLLHSTGAGQDVLRR